jgi:hypothetical protein
VDEHSLTGEASVGVPVGLESDGRQLRMSKERRFGESLMGCNGEQIFQKSLNKGSYFFFRSSV